MELTDIKKLQRVKLPNKDFKAVYDLLKKDTENFSDDFLELYEDEIKELLKAVEKYSPEAIKKTPVKVPREKTPRPPKNPVIDFDSEDVVAEVQRDYNLSKEQAIKLIALRKEAYELKKENIEKLLDRLDKSEFYQGKNYASKSPIDKGRSRDLGKDSKQGAITEAEERKMTGTKFKRLSKKGAKNQYGTTEGGKVYYEYRLNRRDVDNKIRLKNGGGIPNAEKMFHLPMEIAIYVPSTKDVSNSITASELRTRVKEVESYLAETFGGFTTSEKVGGYLSSKSSVIREKVVPVTAFATAEAFTSNKSKLVNKMSVWAKKWGQEAIGFEFEGDLYYVPQKFKKGGKLTATYIPKRDIKMLTTVWGNNIRGKDLLDGAYTKRKNIKSEPKMARTMFEDEMFEYGEGGGVPNAKNIGIMESYREWVSDLRNQSYPRMSVSVAIKEASKYMLFRYSKAELIEAIKNDSQIDMFGMEKTWINALNRAKKPKYEDGGGVHTMPNGELMLDSAHYETGGLLKDPKDLYKLLNQAEINWQKDDGAEYKKIQMEIAKNNNLYYKQLNDAEKNYFQDKGAEYQRLIKMKSKFEKGGKTKPKEPTVVRGYFDDEPYEYAKGGMLDVEDFEALKKGDLISISYSSPISGNNQANLIVKSKTIIGKGKVYEAEKITFTNTANPTGVNFYAYNRVRQMHQKIGFAIGDLAIWNVKLN